MAAAAPKPPRDPHQPRQLELLSVEQLVALGEDPLLEHVAIADSGDPAAVGVDLAGSTWDGVAVGRVSLADMQVEHATMTDVTFDGTDLANVSARGSSLVRVRGRNVRAVGMSLSDGRLQDVVFEDALLDLARFRFTRFERAIFRGCSMRDVDLSSATLVSVLFDGCDLTQVDLTKTTFQSCAMHGCTLEDARGLSSLAGVSMSLTDVIELAPAFARAVGVTITD